MSITPSFSVLRVAILVSITFSSSITLLLFSPSPCLAVNISTDAAIYYPSDLTALVNPAVITIYNTEPTFGINSTLGCGTADPTGVLSATGYAAIGINMATDLSNEAYVYNLGLRHRSPDTLSNSIWTWFKDGTNATSPFKKVQIDTTISKNTFFYDAAVSCIFLNQTAAMSNHQLRFYAREPGVQIAYVNVTKLPPPRILRAYSVCPGSSCSTSSNLPIRIFLDAPVCTPLNANNFGRILINDGKFVCASTPITLSSPGEYYVDCTIPATVYASIASQGGLTVSIDWPTLSSSSTSPLFARQQAELASSNNRVAVQTDGSPADNSLIIILVCVLIPLLLIFIIVRIFFYYREQRLLQEGFRDVSNAPHENGEKVAIIFTDLQSSTNLWATVPRSCSAALEIHNRIFRKHIAEKGAYEVKTNGDQFIIACRLLPSDGSENGKFTAQEVAKLIVDVQREFMSTPMPAAIDAVYNAKSDDDLFDIDDDPAMLVEAMPNAVFHGLRVRMGMACGEIKPGELEAKWDPTTKAYDYFAQKMNLAARCESAAQGGQILLCPLSASLINPSKLGCTTSSVGRVDLKGFPQPIELFQLLPNELIQRSKYFAPSHNANSFMSNELKQNSESNEVVGGSDIAFGVTGSRVGVNNNENHEASDSSGATSGGVNAVNTDPSAQAQTRFVGYTLDDFLMLQVMLRPLGPKEKHTVVELLLNGWRISNNLRRIPASSPIPASEEEAHVHALAQRVGKVKSMIKNRDAKKQSRSDLVRASLVSRDTAGTGQSLSNNTYSNRKASELKVPSPGASRSTSGFPQQMHQPHVIYEDVSNNSCIGNSALMSPQKESSYVQVHNASIDWNAAHSNSIPQNKYQYYRDCTTSRSRRRFEYLSW